MKKVLILAAIAICWNGLGQEKEEDSGLWYIHFDQVIPDMEEAYVQAAKEWVDAFTKADMGPDWTYFTSSSDDFMYITGWRLKNFAMLDDSDALEKEMTEKVGADTLKALMERQSVAISSHHSEIARHLPDLSYRPAKPLLTNPMPGYSRVGVHWVRPGQEKAFKETIKSLKAALAKVEHGLGFETYEVVFGTGSYIMVWAADDPGQFFTNNNLRKVLSAALGPEGAMKLYADWRATISKFESHDNRPRPDLSYFPGMAEGDAEGE